MPQRLPIVNSDDGTWGTILNQFLEKEHLNTGTDVATNGNHKSVTIAAVTATSPVIAITGTLSDADVISVTPTVTTTGANNALALNLSPTLDPPDTKRALGAYMLPTVIATAAETVESYRGIEIDTAIKSGTGSITNSYQLYVRDSDMATNNYGVVIEASGTGTLWISSKAPDTTTANAGIAFGSSKDTNLYRSDTNTLKTDDNLIVAGASTAANSAATIDATQTLTNKRVTPRAGSTSSSATPTINTDNVDTYSITALATDITSFTTNLSGTPTNFQKLIIRIKDDGAARAITWGASFVAKGVTLPTTTVISKLLTVGFIYDTVAGTWGCVASAQEA